MANKHPKPKERFGIDHYGRTELHYAAAEGATERVEELLATGLAADGPDDDGWTPLHYAAQASSAPVARLLLNAGAAVDSQDRHGNTPLFRAVFSSRGEGALIELLLASGADPRTENAHGVSPVGLAHSIANYDVARFFRAFPGESPSRSR